MTDGKKIGKQWVIRLSIQPLLRLLPGFFYIANLIRMLMISSVPYFIILYLTGGVGLFLTLFLKKRKLDNIILFLLFYFFTLVVNLLTVGNISFNNLIVNVLLVGITLMMLIKPWTYREGVIVFYLTALIMAYAMNASAVRRILVSSTNYISILMILSAAFYYIALEKDERVLKLIDILPALICFLISVWARGRGGILSTAVLLVLMLFLYIRKVSNKYARNSITIILFLFLIGVILLIRNVNLLDAFMSLGKWGTRGTDNSERMLIWSSYFAKMGESIRHVLLGPPLREIPIINLFRENCHNSFLQLHAYNGLLMFAIFVVVLARAFMYYWKRHKYLMIIMLSVLILRGMTDKFIFGQYGMPIMLFLALFPLVDRQQMTNNGIIMGRRI